MKSFTLIEIAVVISIILILSILAFPNFRDAKAKFALDRTIYKLSQDLRNAEEMAMSSRATPPEIFVSSFFPQGGYGLYFQENSSSYILFADCDGDKKYDTAEGLPMANSCSEATNIRPYPEKFKEIPLEAGIKIGTLNPKYSQDNSLAITFFPPDPTITIYPAASTAFITLIFKTKSETASINLNGLIEIQ
jgi:type II secretory pathway pseudopilin PulG